MLGLLLDDCIWLWSIAADHFNSERRSIGLDCPKDIVLSSMLCVGLHNWSEGHQSSDASTRLMRYAACLVDCLWEGMENEHSKVLFPAFPVCRKANSEDRGRL